MSLCCINLVGEQHMAATDSCSVVDHISIQSQTSTRIRPTLVEMALEVTQINSNNRTLTFFNWENTPKSQLFFFITLAWSPDTLGQ